MPRACVHDKPFVLACAPSCATSVRAAPATVDRRFVRGEVQRSHLHGRRALEQGLRPAHVRPAEHGAVRGKGLPSLNWDVRRRDHRGGRGGSLSGQPFRNVCLINALRGLGYKAAFEKDGPLWALADGSRLLAPLGATMAEVSGVNMAEDATPPFLCFPAKGS